MTFAGSWQYFHGTALRAAELLCPRVLDARQALRLRRAGLAVLSYCLAASLLGIASVFGVLPAPAALAAGAAFVTVYIALYAAIRSGLNLRFADPSLTGFQIIVAITILMFVVYSMDAGRNIALSGCFVIFLFGIFRLSARKLSVHMLYTLAAYALVVNLLMHLRPQAVQDVALEWLSWLGLAGLLPFFVLIGGQMSALRRKLRESEVRFRSLTEMSSDFYWESDREHRLSERGSAGRNPSTVTAFQTGAQIGARRWEVPHLSPDEAGWRAHRADLEAHRPFRDFQLSRLGVDGSERHISVSGDPVFEPSGEFVGYRGVGTDVTAKKRIDQALRDGAEKLRVFSDNVPAMAAYWDRDMRCVFANRALLEFWGLAAADVVGKRVREIYALEIYVEVEGHAVRALQGETVTFHRTRLLADGRSRFLEIQLVPHFSEQGRVLGYFSLTTDITEHKLTEARIQSVAHHDSLTGLPNRLLFNDRLAQAIAQARRQARRFALLYLDLNKFKRVNDTQGHAAGDELLLAVSSRISEEVRESDTVARVGGDEFTIILGDIRGRGEAQAVSDKIAAVLAEPFRLGERRESVEIGASIGIAMFPDDAPDADALVKAADAAMYGAKRSTRSDGSAPHPARAIAPHVP